VDYPHAQSSEGSVPPGLAFTAHAETHVGMVRKVNEDAILDSSQIGLWVVADGVGGAEAGDRASQLIVNSLAALAAPVDGLAFLENVQIILQDVNRQLLAEAAAGRLARVIASTVVCLLFFEGWYCCVWAGDSRIYRLRGDQFEQITHDHSEVQCLVDYGFITLEEARVHPNANVITRAVGADQVLRLDAVEGVIEPGDAFLLCSDGLTKVVEDWEIGATLAPLAPQEAVRQLIQMTLDRGAPDNVSVAVVKIGNDGVHRGNETAPN
jgi:serine/threonine-protein phosphatase Stp1